MTKLPEGQDRGGQQRRCAWCGRPIAVSGGPGRPRRYCRRSCRQRDFEARQRAHVHGLDEGELIVARRALSHLDDLVYVLSCAVQDVERDLEGEHDADDVARSLDWLLEAARPLAALSQAGNLLERLP